MESLEERVAVLEQMVVRMYPELIASKALLAALFTAQDDPQKTLDQMPMVQEAYSVLSLFEGTPDSMRAVVEALLQTQSATLRQLAAAVKKMRPAG